MELNIPNPEAWGLAAAFGITPEREKELQHKIYAFMRKVGPSPAMIHWQHMLLEMADFCDTKEELLLCTVIRCAWLQRDGKAIAG
jgi:hypothetical protein